MMRQQAMICTHGLDTCHEHMPRQTPCRGKHQMEVCYMTSLDNNSESSYSIRIQDVNISIMKQDVPGRNIYITSP